MWIHDLNTVLDVALFLCFFIVGVFVFKGARRKYLKIVLENKIIGMYGLIPSFEREDIKTFRESLNQVDGIINQECINHARFLLDIRERVLNAKEEKDVL